MHRRLLLTHFNLACKCIRDFLLKLSRGSTTIAVYSLKLRFKSGRVVKRLEWRVKRKAFSLKHILVLL